MCVVFCDKLIVFKLFSCLHISLLAEKSEESCSHKMDTQCVDETGVAL